jgi:hypothetical protein
MFIVCMDGASESESKKGRDDDVLTLRCLCSLATLLAAALEYDSP